MTYAPLILTASLDAASFERLDRLRQEHFPPGRNFLAAHVTMFHHLPGAGLEKIVAVLESISEHQQPIEVSFPGLRFLGRGVAVDLASVGLVRIRSELAARWLDRLTPQDRQKFRPHVTVQNKVEPAVARELYDKLASSFEIRHGFVTGLKLWHYAGGPWLPEREFPFPFTARS